MIAGATRGTGGPALARHLMSRKGNQTVEIMLPRSLMGETLREQIDDLLLTSAHGRTSRPVHHVHIDPPPDCADPEAVIEKFMRHYEAEFGFESAQRAGVFHTKNGRKHGHVVYSLVCENGSVVSLAHDHARREKVSRITEFECGLPFTKGKHNRSAAAALRRDGRADVADAMEAAGLLDGRRGIAHSTPRQRAQAERTAVQIDDIRSEAFAAWRSSDDAKSFAVALHTFGSSVTTGERGLVLVDRAGGTHSLNRVLAAAARAAGEDKITAAAVRKRLAGIRFQTVEEAKNVRSKRRNSERGNGGSAGGTEPAAALGVAEGRGRDDEPDRGNQGPAAGDCSNSAEPERSPAAHRKRVRDRAASLALSTIDLQAINATRRDVMRELKAQDYKAKILSKIAPKGFNAHAFALDLHMIKQPSPGNTTSRIMTTDGGWIEYDAARKSVRTWGPSGRAQVLAAALAAHVSGEVYHLAKTASVGADADALKVAKTSEDTIKSLVMWWSVRGYSATGGPDGCWINAGTARIRDTGNRLDIHGGLTDDAVAAILTKAKDAWGSSVQLNGAWTQAEQDRLWIAAMREGIAIGNCRPSQGIQQAWQREQEAAAAKTKTISAVRTEIIEAQHLLDAARGDIEAAKKLPGTLQAFVGIHLDDDQRKELAAQPIAEIVPHLARFRKLGAVELEAYKAPPGRKVAFAEPEKDKPSVGPSGAHGPK
ncbi:relaxase/mobilization nuclease domain-containing protein [Tardiphaga sp. 841_E9_N1_2]|uniref:relaxase/mobilization nuclease domain-containing protein n=1 Tax=Tardiphaga sp. 841_E9_N1_2 TaxID=3240762 RepID=UPI003F259EDA